jgi:hypothetical protein
MGRPGPNGPSGAARAMLPQMAAGRLEQIAFGLDHFMIQTKGVNLLYYNVLDRIHVPSLDQE